jgi:hypothetical protein
MSTLSCASEHAPGIWRDDQVAGWRDVTKSARQSGGRIGWMFLANPDLPTRIRENGSYNGLRCVGLYGGDDTGHIDDPALLGKRRSLARPMADGRAGRPPNPALLFMHAVPPFAVGRFPC